MGQRKDGGKSNFIRTAKYYCGNCAEVLGRGSRQTPSVWCNICGWVHFKCSGLQHVTDYKREAEFLCSKCAVTRRLVESTKESVAHSKIHGFYTSCNNPSAFAGRNAVKRASKCSYRQMDNYLNCSETYTKFKQTENRFPRLKVQSFRLNEIWSVDLAHMQKLSRYNHGVNFILVAVDTLSRFVWALPLKKNTAVECKNALQQILEALCSRNDCQKAMMKPKFCQIKSSNQPKPEKLWVDKGQEFAGEFSKFCQKNNINVYSTHSETKSVFAE